MNMELSIHHLNGLPNGHLSNPNHPNLVIAFKPLQLCDVDCPLTLIQMEWNCMKLLMKWLLIMKILLQDFWRDGIKWLPMATGRDLLLPTFLVCNSTFQIKNAVLCHQCVHYKCQHSHASCQLTTKTLLQPYISDSQ